MGTALVTGASSGIGLEITWRLAARHHDLVLVSRDEEALEALADQLTQVAGVGAQVLPADLSTTQGRELVAQRLREGDPAPARQPLATGGARVARRIATPEEVAARPVDLLVNNAGFAVGQEFVGGDLDQERRAAAVMVQAVLELTHAALPGMVRRGHGAVLNVSSMTALTAMGTYAAHKNWVRSFTEALASELAGTGVGVTALCPGLVRTEFHERAGMEEVAAGWPALAWLDAGYVADQALAALDRRQVLCTPSLRYKAVNALLRVGPRFLVRRVAGHGSVRTRY